MGETKNKQDIPLNAHSQNSAVEFDAVRLEDGSPALCYTSTDGTCKITIYDDKNLTCLSVILICENRKAAFFKTFDNVISAFGFGKSIAEFSIKNGFADIVKACKQHEMSERV